MRGILLSTATTMAVVLLPLVGRAAELDTLTSLNLEVPSSDATPDGPGADAMNGNCLACHSADHLLNQPRLPKETWDEIVHKMISAYKAPIAPEDVAPIVDYLARTKGVM